MFSRPRRSLLGCWGLPVEFLAGVGAGGGLVACEDRARGAEGLCRYRLDGQVQSSADDGGDGANLVSFVGHGVPRGAGFGVFQGEWKPFGNWARLLLRT